MTVYEDIEFDRSDEVPFELEQIVVGNMPFSLRDYEYAVASGIEAVELSEPRYRTVSGSPGLGILISPVE